MSEKDLQMKDADDAERPASTEEKKKAMVKLGVHIDNLIIAKAEREILALGDVDSFVRFIDEVDVQSIIWNESYLVAVTEDKRQLLAFVPEIEPTVQIFFSRDEKRRYDDNEGSNIRVWEGEYSPVEFTKANLVKFLKENAKKADRAILDAVKNLKIVEKTESNSNLIPLEDGSLDDQNVETIERETSQTNIPSKFIMRMPIVSTPKFSYEADMEFEAKVVKAKDNYGNDKGKKMIQLRVVNARAIMRDLMNNILNRVPNDIPNYYGKMSLKESK